MWRKRERTRESERVKEEERESGSSHSMDILARGRTDDFVSKSWRRVIGKGVIKVTKRLRLPETEEFLGTGDIQC